MANSPDARPDAPLALADVLTADDEIAVFAELEALKLRMDVDKARFEELKEEAGALVAVAGGTSGAYGQIVVALRPGGPTKKFDEQRLLTTKVECPSCHQPHFYPSGQISALYEYGSRKDSIEVSIAGSRGRRKER